MLDDEHDQSERTTFSTVEARCAKSNFIDTLTEMVVVVCVKCFKGFDNGILYISIFFDERFQLAFEVRNDDDMCHTFTRQRVVYGRKGWLDLDSVWKQLS